MEPEQELCWLPPFCSSFAPWSSRNKSTLSCSSVLKLFENRDYISNSPQIPKSSFLYTKHSWTCVHVLIWQALHTISSSWLSSSGLTGLGNSEQSPSTHITCVVKPTQILHWPYVRHWGYGTELSITSFSRSLSSKSNLQACGWPLGFSGKWRGKFLEKIFKKVIVRL